MSATEITRVEGETPTLLADWDQRHASALDMLRDADAYVVLTYDAETDSMEMRAGSHCLATEGMLELLNRAAATAAEMARDLCEDRAT